MPAQGNASLPVIKRLPKYYRYLCMMQKNGITEVSSKYLADTLGTTASQVRQDFNCFASFGRQGIGYEVDKLVDELGKLLFGSGEPLPSIMVGAGRLGSAVSRFIANETSGYKLLAAFDGNAELVGKDLNGVPIYHTDDLEKFCRENHVAMAVLCLPRTGAIALAPTLVEAGVKGFWNFSHYDLVVDYPQLVVENVHLGDSLMSLSYRLRNEQ